MPANEVKKIIRENMTDSNLAVAVKLTELGKLPGFFIDSLDEYRKARIDRQNEEVDRQLRNIGYLENRLQKFEAETVAPAKERLRNFEAAADKVKSIVGL